MSNQQPQTTNSGTKTLRLTENKRRYRARRKAYISDLETIRAEAREQGVQATKEVQLAARQVILKNGRLRDLLRLAGFSNADIDSWLAAGCGGPGGDANKSNCDRQSHVEQKARRCATALAACEETAAREWMTPSRDIARGKGPVKAIDVSDMASTSQPLDTDDALTSDGSKSNASGRSPDFEAATAHMPVPSLITRTSPIPEAETSSHTCHNDKRITPSCKLLTRLTENPAADITQVPITVPSSSDDEPHQDAGASRGGASIECREAYDMLIQYATTEEKMDTIARALESGCTKNGKGGCAVKAEVVLQALDHMCG
ncbi:hypothetical protein GE09DRAFT_277987 [Coniochaeta sp. 2T2.1]|nr:hypothetical protein GE09DRAFT_277987 [Coniochaeta sp. 2T2.1]